MKRRILFVDEEFAPDSDEELGSYMSYYAIELTDAGHEVIRCRDVDAALANVRDQQFDLIILDGMMPTGDALKDSQQANGGYTGWVLAERIHGSKPNAPILILTNYPEFQEQFEGVISRGVIRRVVSKLQSTPTDLAKIVDELFAGNK